MASWHPQTQGASIDQHSPWKWTQQWDICNFYQVKHAVRKNNVPKQMPASLYFWCTMPGGKATVVATV